MRFQRCRPRSYHDQIIERIISDPERLGEYLGFPVGSIETDVSIPNGDGKGTFCRPDILVRGTEGEVAVIEVKGNGNHGREKDLRRQLRKYSAAFPDASLFVAHGTPEDYAMGRWDGSQARR